MRELLYKAADIVLWEKSMSDNREGYRTRETDRTSAYFACKIKIIIIRFIKKHDRRTETLSQFFCLMLMSAMNLFCSNYNLPHILPQLS